ncbi:hypothetical protein RHMOL_Rhmol01G0179800 [Rhododendron molle]|uniref:Uncharacterized protein n=1 Tax=Rhododendron molle TaxID=49168 RepID=A0ACC0Q5D7_RHOML|nr:hypothetical protein RHMOL_Rhmol01G0179800 [Rhododendron molle]
MGDFFVVHWVGFEDMLKENLVDLRLVGKGYLGMEKFGIVGMDRLGKVVGMVVGRYFEVSFGCYVSGYKNRFQNFIRYLREMGDEVMVVTTHEGVPQEFYGPKLIGSRSFPCPWYQKVPLSLALSPRIISEVANFKPDIIHASSPGIMDEGQTDTELKEKKLRVEDALNATKVSFSWDSAVEEGIVGDGRCTLLRLVSKVDAIRIALRMMRKRFLSNDNPKFRYNAGTGEYEHLMAARIIDPTKQNTSNLRWQ